MSLTMNCSLKLRILVRQSCPSCPLRAPVQKLPCPHAIAITMTMTMLRVPTEQEQHTHGNAAQRGTRVNRDGGAGRRGAA